LKSLDPDEEIQENPTLKSRVFETKRLGAKKTQNGSIGPKAPGAAKKAYSAA
jgi:hypothetical protein